MLKMPQYIKDTYLLFCGKYSQQVYDYVYLKYCIKERPNIYLSNYLSKDTISGRVIRASNVEANILMYNVYNERELFSDVDWTSWELSRIFKK